MVVGCPVVAGWSWVVRWSRVVVARERSCRATLRAAYDLDNVPVDASCEASGALNGWWMGNAPLAVWGVSSGALSR